MWSHTWPFGIITCCQPNNLIKIGRIEQLALIVMEPSLIVLRQTFEAAGVRFTEDGGIVPPKRESE